LDNGFHFFWEIPIEKSRTQTVFKSVPNNRFFLETDTAEENIYAVYALAANIRHVNLNSKTNK
jgi:TatD DNase family protein